jgi:hypothetical protein
MKIYDGYLAIINYLSSWYSFFKTLVYLLFGRCPFFFIFLFDLYSLRIEGGDCGPAAAAQRGQPGGGHHPPSADGSADCQQTGQRQAGTGQCQVSPYEQLTDKLVASRQDNAKLEQDNAR